MRRFIAVLAVGGLVLTVEPAAADPIQILSGNLDFDSGDPPGFRFNLAQAPFRLGGAVLEPDPVTGDILVFPPGSGVACLFLNPCADGSRVNLGITITGRGLARMGTAVDSDDPDASSPAEVTFNFRTPEVLLTGQPDEIVLLQAPFEFDGVLRLFADPSFAIVTFEATLAGRGTATAEMGPGASLFGWEESVFTFESDVAPVPEPATCTLLATGLGALWVRRRRRT